MERILLINIMMKKIDLNDYTSSHVDNNEKKKTESADANEDNISVEKSPWYYIDDQDSRHDSYQTDHYLI
jgi:hypothetical protein